MKPWFHAIGDRGPDWTLSLEVKPEHATRLGDLVGALSLAGFRRCGAEDRVVRFVDAANAEAFEANLVGASPTNLWVFHAITVEGATLELRRGYAGYDARSPDELAASEARVLDAVLRDPALEVVRWRIDAEGDGYRTVPIASGRDAASLHDYLA